MASPRAACHTDPTSTAAAAHTRADLDRASPRRIAGVDPNPTPTPTPNPTPTPTPNPTPIAGVDSFIADGEQVLTHRPGMLTHTLIHTHTLTHTLTLTPTLTLHPNPHSNPTPYPYSLTDQGYGLKGNNVSLVLNWNTVPALCENKQGGSGFGQLALRRPLSALDRASGCPELRPAPANQPLGPR